MSLKQAKSRLRYFKLGKVQTDKNGLTHNLQLIVLPTLKKRFSLLEISSRRFSRKCPFCHTLGRLLRHRLNNIL